ncbi:MAG: hypothetical protein HC769_12545 [Cyanobacteria bacterium CRU_2_1]|nr:hypothetical protein [Cyanobacteria bacterium RU_5_0]NJR59596.1 hypothetical protein [Cyanobacteria bacterium CRU_2_1]
MSNNNLSFLDDGQSIASTVTHLHNYFRHVYSQHKIKRSELVSRLDAATEEEEQNVLQQLRQVDEELTLFGILSDSLSAVNRVVHSRAVANVLGVEAELYQVHLEDEAEQLTERQVAQRRATQGKES